MCFRVVRACRCPSVRACVRASVRPSVHPSVRDSRGSFMFPRYLQYLLTDFRQTFVTGASWDRDELIRFWGQRVKVQGHTIAAEAHSTRRYRRVPLFLVLSAAVLYDLIALIFVKAPCWKFGISAAVMKHTSLTHPLSNELPVAFATRRMYRC